MKGSDINEVFALAWRNSSVFLATWAYTKNWWRNDPHFANYSGHCIYCR